MTESSAGEFAIAVLGRMNPAIHSPDWYRYMELISDDELKRSRGAGLAITQVAAQFQAPALGITCTEGKWLIRTSEENVQRAADVAEKVFESLDQTPVKAFGMNFSRHIDTERDDAQDLLKKGVGEVLGLSDDLKSCSIKYSMPIEGRTLNVAVEPSQRGQAVLFMSLNYDYQISTPGHFSLGPLIQDAALRDKADCVKRRQSLTNAILKER